MATNNGSETSAFYQQVQTDGHLHTNEQAVRWSSAVLRTLSLNLSRGTKKSLAKELPEPLAFELKRQFWLVHFRNKSITLEEFLRQTARRGGQTDWTFAHFPTKAIFAGMKGLVSDEVAGKVSDNLAPELKTFWDES